MGSTHIQHIYTKASVVSHVETLCSWEGCNFQSQAPHKKTSMTNDLSPPTSCFHGCHTRPLTGLSHVFSSEFSCLKKCFKTQVWWYKLVILILKRQREDDCWKTKASLGYTVSFRPTRARKKRHYLKKKKKKGGRYHNIGSRIYNSSSLN